jgi:hypothetical protein
MEYDQGYNYPEQQQPSSQMDMAYAESMREDKLNNILAQINPDNLLTDIEHRIRGQKKNQYSKQWEDIAPNAKKKVPEQLISDFVSYLGAILNQGTSMSNFSIEQINNLMKMIYKWVARRLDTHCEEYGLQGDYTEMDRIGHIVCMSSYTVLLRALNGMEARRVFGSLKMVETMQPEKKSIMDHLKFWK